MSDLSALPSSVQAYVRGYGQRGRRLAALKAAGASAAFFLGTLLTACLIDRFAHFSAGLRWGLLAVTGVVSLLLLLRPLLRMSRPEVDWLAVAARIERQTPRFEQRLLTVVSRLVGRADYRGSDDMLGQLASELDREADRESPRRLLPLRIIAGPWLLLLAIGGAVCGLASIPDLNLPKLGLRFLLPWEAIDPVTTTQISVRPGNTDLPQGSPLHIEAAIEHLGGGPVWLFLAEGENGAWQRLPMSIEDPVRPATPLTGIAPQPVGEATPGSAMFDYLAVSVDQDVRYYITAGDCVSHTFTVRVLRKPAIAEFRIRYIFPVQTGRPPLSFTNSDGRIDAPAGTEAQLTIVATEPLQSALLTWAGEKQSMERAPDDRDHRAWRGTLKVTRDGKYDVDLVTVRSQTGTAPPTTEVHAVPDRPPISRLASAGQTLRASAREILPVGYDAFDDYGIESLSLRVAVGSAPAVDIPIMPHGPEAGGPSQVHEDRRRREGVFDLDLAGLRLTVGDLATLVLVARDTSGNTAYSDGTHLVISPRSGGVDAYERTVDLELAAQLAGSVVDDLEGAAKALGDDDGNRSRGGTSASGRASRRLNSSASTSAMIRRTLLRSLARDASADMAAAMVGWVDAAQQQSVTGEALFHEVGSDSHSVDYSVKPSPRSRPSRQMLQQAAQQLADSGRRLRGELQTVSRGERAATILADLENVVAAQKRGAGPNPDKAVSERFRQSIQRLREEIASGAKGLGLGDAVNDLPNRLPAIVEEGRKLVKSRAKVDLLPAVKDWAQQVQRNSWQPISLDERLIAFAEAEAARPGGDLRIARDYNLCGRAASAIEAAADRALPVPVSPGVANQFVSAFEAVRREHELNHRAPGPVKLDEEQVIRASAAKARLLLARWAGDAETSGANATATGPATNPVAAAAIKAARTQAMALQAGAAAADRQYAAAASADSQLAAQVGQQPDSLAATTARQALAQVQNATATARQADELGVAQGELAKQTAVGREGKPTDAPGLATRQAAVAEQIGNLASHFAPIGADMSATTDANGRDRAAAAYAAAQGRLAALPQQVADLLDDDATRREAAARALNARRDADAAVGEQRPAARRMAEMAASDEADATARVSEAARSVSPDMARAMLAALEPLGVESLATRDVIGERLAPALTVLIERSKMDDPVDRVEMDRAAAEVRQCIEQAQIALARSQQELADQDPLTSAKWYARSAAEALQRKPPDFRSAQTSQGEAKSALDKAWEQSLRYASNQRMVAVRSLRPAPLTPMGNDAPVAGAPADASGRTSALGAIAGEWRRLRPRELDDPTGMLNDPEPPGYEAAIKAYFEAMGKK